MVWNGMLKHQAAVVVVVMVTVTVTVLVRSYTKRGF